MSIPPIAITILVPRSMIAPTLDFNAGVAERLADLLGYPIRARRERRKGSDSDSDLFESRSIHTASVPITGVPSCLRGAGTPGEARRDYDRQCRTERDMN